jgi:hypothetical protein
MQYTTWLKCYYKIQTKRCLKKILLEFSKCNFLFLINLVQETFVNLIKVFKLKNYFTTLF